MSQPFISVIVVAYNYETLLPRALEAIKKQTYKDFEVVLVNNGSTDNTQGVIDDFVSNNPDIRVVKVLVENNQGVFLGRNQGIEAATGQYIMFNDADDWMEPECLEKLSARAKESNADKVCGAFMEIDTEGKQLRIVDFTSEYSKWFTVSLQATLFRRTIVMENNIRFHQSWLDDIDFNTQFNYYTVNFAMVNEPVYDYYVNQHSTSGAKVKKKSWTYLDLQHDMLELFVPMIEKIEAQDKIDLSYLMVKQYYFYLFHSNRYSTISEFVDNYNAANKMMLEYMPNYLKDRNERHLRKNSERKSGVMITKIFTTAERIHCMKFVMRMYLLASKVTYLNP